VAPISVVAALAAYVDELLAEHWEDPGLTLAIARSGPGEQLDVVGASDLGGGGRCEGDPRVAVQGL
jgi:hypothetical protein